MHEYWQIFLAVLALVATWSGIIIAAVRVMFGRSLDNVDTRITTFIGTVEKKLIDFSVTIDKRLTSFGPTERLCCDLQRELLELKAQLPLEYVRREDFIRFEVGINYKLDKLRDLFLEKFNNREQN